MPERIPRHYATGATGCRKPARRRERRMDLNGCARSSGRAERGGQGGMIGNTVPGVAGMNLRRLDAEAPHIDALKLEHGQDGRLTACRLAVVSLEYLDQTKFVLERPSCPHQPVV